ncbi:hypothetical protein SMICM304S_07940 [Streptomyces microflavus]
MIRTSGLATAYAMFLASAVICSTFTAGPSWIVPRGRRAGVKQVTRASTLNSVKTVVSAADYGVVGGAARLAGPPRWRRSREGSA